MARMCTEKSIFVRVVKQARTPRRLFICFNWSKRWFFPSTGRHKKLSFAYFHRLLCAEQENDREKMLTQPIFMSWYSNTVARSTIMLLAGNGLRGLEMGCGGKIVESLENMFCGTSPVSVITLYLRMGFYMEKGLAAFLLTIPTKVTNGWTVCPGKRDQHFLQITLYKFYLWPATAEPTVAIY